MKIYEFWEADSCTSKYFSRKSNAVISGIKWLLKVGEGSEEQLNTFLSDDCVEYDGEPICAIYTINTED